VHISDEGASTLLEVRDLVVSYRSIVAVHGIDLTVRDGEIVCLVGPNGAGKTSTLSAISGAIRPRSGTVRFDDRPLVDLAAEGVVRCGISLVPEGRRIFQTLTVAENLGIPVHLRKDKAAAREDLDRMLDLFPILRTRLGGVAGKLSGGEQQQLAIARALLCAPRLLLVDEPSLGLAPRVIEDVYVALIDLNRSRGLSLLIVEQSVERATRYSDRYYVIRNGAIVREGVTRHDDLNALQEAYFGYPEARAS
jgi:branched-chain amino acid transport system ATP-binding protein